MRLIKMTLAATAAALVAVSASAQSDALPESGLLGALGLTPEMVSEGIELEKLYIEQQNNLLDLIAKCGSPEQCESLNKAFEALLASQNGE